MTFDLVGAAHLRALSPTMNLIFLLEALALWDFNSPSSQLYRFGNLVPQDVTVVHHWMSMGEFIVRSVRFSVLWIFLEMAAFYGANRCT